MAVAHVLMGGGFIAAGCMLIPAGRKMRDGINGFCLASRLQGRTTSLVGWACIGMGVLVIIALAFPS
jgi:hypothetical protein